MCSCEFCEIFKNTFLVDHLQEAAFVCSEYKLIIHSDFMNLWVLTRANLIFC